MKLCTEVKYLADLNTDNTAVYQFSSDRTFMLSRSNSLQPPVSSQITPAGQTEQRRFQSALELSERRGYVTA